VSPPEPFNGLRMALQAQKIWNDEHERRRANRNFRKWGLALLLLTAAATFGGALWANAAIVGRRASRDRSRRSGISPWPSRARGGLDDVRANRSAA